MKSLRGFTLIELLVVIAIIAVLAAILFPVFAATREKARQTTCINNEKQICISMMQYAQDFDETFPMCWTIESANSGGRFATGYSSWDDLLTPYNSIKINYNRGQNLVFQCPDDILARAVTGSYRSYALAGATNAAISPYTHDGVTSVGVGDQGFAGKTQSGLANWLFQSGHQQSVFDAPANTLMLVEIPGAAHVGNEGDAVCFRPGQPGNNPNVACDSSTGGCGQSKSLAKSALGLHNNGWNYGFADGHVKWVDPRQTLPKTTVNITILIVTVPSIAICMACGQLTPMIDRLCP